MTEADMTFDEIAGLIVIAGIVYVFARWLTE